MSERQIKELVLGTGQYAYLQDLTNGAVKVYTGPCVINQSAQDRPVIYDKKRGWVTVESLAEAIRPSPIAVEGFYLTLFNPPQLANAQSIEEAQPKDGVTGQRSPQLDVGKRVNIPGPTTFPLWPGQMAKHTKGHQLRSNQFLLVEVYNEAEATKNWKKAVVQSTTGENTELEQPQALTVGTTLVVKGTEVSFYIPPTGIKVKARGPEDFVDSSNPDPYVRDALTLERLEYAILVHENGKKRYEEGPQVVFPEPTEKFVSEPDSTDGKPTRRFRALELTPIQGIHLKVIAAYTEGEREYKEGEELFITGKETAIYYPREEHALIAYDGQPKHFATAIPAGEARYVMNRLTGDILTVKGPAMYLPDPRTEVFVRRGLTDEQCQLWYPGNTEALAYNQSLRTMVKGATTRSGVVSDTDYTRGAVAAAASALKGGGHETIAAANLLSSNAAFTMKDQSHQGVPKNLVADKFARGSNYTDPRTLTLNTRFQGVPTIDLWPGYAVTVTRKGAGPEGRRVVVGPATVHLDYEESLEVLELSTGRPKTTDRLFKTVYLKALANRVSDLVEVETSDHVKVNLKLAYEVHFEGDNNKWFNLENYVKYMTDRMRSILKGAVHKLPIATFYANATDIVRTIILKDGDAGSPGYFFEENNMRVGDLDLFEVTILNPEVKRQLDEQQGMAIKSNIEIATTQNTRAAVEQLETLKREIEKIKLESRKQELLNRAADLLANHTLEVEKAQKSKALEAEKQELQAATNKTADAQLAAQLQRERLMVEAELLATTERNTIARAALEAQTKAIVETFGAVAPGLTEAVAALTQGETAVNLARAVSVQNILGGGNLVDTIRGLFTGTPMEGILQRTLTTRLPAPNGVTTPPRS